MKKCLLVISGALMWAGILIAQPANDDCVNATPLNYAATEGELVLVNGDTRGATPDSSAGPVCSGTWWFDEVWFSLTVPDPVPSGGIIVRAYFGDENDDLPAVGMAFYESCDPDEVAYQCFSSEVADANSLTIGAGCLQSGSTYLIRLWSGVSPNANSGTFRIGAFANPEEDTDIVLWEETWADGLAGWTTYGTCGGNPDSNANAVWRWNPSGVFDMGAFANVGVGVSGPTVCDGAVGVDSDFDDNNGLPDNFGNGPCPAGNGSQYFLESPVIYHGDWDVAGISLSLVQGLREFLSEHFVGFRTYEAGVWSDWNDILINTEYPQNSAHFNNESVRLFLSGATSGDSIQIRLRYDANYYYWAVDDIRLIETEAHNVKLDESFVTYQLPIQGVRGQGIPWTPQVDIVNIGAEPQTNVTLRATVEDPQGTMIYDESVNFKTLETDSSIVNLNSTIMVPYDIATGEVGTYRITYTVTSDSTDFNPLDNTITYEAYVDEDVFAVERGPTRTIAGAPGNWTKGAPHSFIFGNYFHTPQGSIREVLSGTFGLGNVDALIGETIGFVLFRWNSGLEDQNCQAGERDLIAFAEYTPGPGDGGSDGDTIITVEFENLETAGPIVLADNTSYIVAVQWDSPGDDGDLVMLASDEVDYGQTIQQLLELGTPHYTGMLAVPMDGINDGIDIGTDTYNDGASGRSIMPVARLNTDMIIAVEDPLPVNNIVKLYPNPASEFVAVDFELERAFDRVDLEIVTLEGKVISGQTLYNVEKQKVALDVSQYPTGTYLAFISTEDGSRYVPFIVQR